MGIHGEKMGILEKRRRYRWLQKVLINFKKEGNCHKKCLLPSFLKLKESEKKKETKKKEEVPPDIYQCPAAQLVKSVSPLKIPKDWFVSNFFIW